MDWCKRGGSRDYITTRDIEWSIGAKGSEWKLPIPAGFEFESSVPKFLHWLFSPHNPKFLKSACVHDFLLEQKEAKPVFAASQWLEAAYSEHANEWIAIPAFLGVLFYTITVKKFRKRNV